MKYVNKKRLIYINGVKRACTMEYIDSQISIPVKERAHTMECVHLGQHIRYSCV